MTTPATVPIVLHLYEDLVTRSGHRHLPIEAHRIPGEGTTGRWLVEYIRVELGLADLAPVSIVRNGKPVLPADLVAIDIDAGDVFLAAPRPSTWVDAVLIGIAIASAAASAYLASRVRLPGPTGEGDGAERRYGFNRFSNTAIVGDVIPVPYGRRRRYGGRVIAQVPVESSDGSGNTKVKILVCLGHGEIQAIGDQTADFTQSAFDEVEGIFLNDQPLSSFPGTIVSGRLGTSGQEVIPGFGDVEQLREIGVGGVELRNTDGVERTGGSESAEAFTFTTDAVNAVIPRIVFPAGLYTVGASGQVDTRRVKYRYRWRLSSGPGAWSAWTVITLERADQSEFFSSPRLDGLAAVAGASVDVQIERVSVESSNVADVDRMFWDSIIQVVYSANTYAGFALLAVEVTAGEQISGGVPRISVDIKGRKVRVWDGISSTSSPTFVEQYSENPAYHLLDYLTDVRYGMGATYGAGSPAGSECIDLANLIAEAVICDELVPRPEGAGFRPRYRFHYVFDQAMDDHEILRTIGASFRCTPMTSGNVWRFGCDRARSAPVEIFTDATIAVDDEGVPMVSYRRELTTRGINRPNQLLCTFENELADGQTDTIAYPRDGEYWLGGGSPEVANAQAIRIDGVTDPDQVNAELWFRLNKIRYLSRSLRLTTTKPVIVAQPQDRIDAGVDLAGYGLASGRILAGCAAGTIILDKTVTLEAAKTYQVEVEHEDGSLEPRTLAAVPSGVYAAGTVLNISGTWASIPKEFEQYSIGETGKVLKPFTVQAVRSTDGDALKWELDLLEYQEGIYQLEPGPVETQGYSSLGNGLTPPGPVLDLRAYERTGNGLHQVALSWSQTPADRQITAAFRIYRRRIGTESWVLTPNASISYHTALIEIGENDVAYEFAVVAVSYGGAALSPYDPRVPHVSIVMGLAGEPPPPPDNPVFTNTGGNTYTLSWDPVENAAGYVVMTRGDSPVDGLGALGGVDDFGHGPRDALILAHTVDPELTGLELPPSETQYFWIRSVLANGRMSYRATGITQTGATPAGESIKQTETFDEATTGDTLTNASWVSVDGVQTLVQTAPATPATWELPIQDSGALTLTELTILPTLKNYAADPLISDDIVTIPSIAADQWGVIDDSPDRVIEMLQPPYPDDEQAWVVEVRTHDGAVWSSWAAIAMCTSIRRTFRQWQVRVGLSRRHHPYRPGIQALTVVLTN